MTTPRPYRPSSTSSRPILLSMVVLVAVALAFAGTAAMWTGSSRAWAQTEETETRSFGSVDFASNTATSMVRGDDESIEVAVSGLIPGEAGNYAVKITSNNRLSESSSCGGSVSETFYPSSTTMEWEFDVYACSTGVGTLTATLTYYYPFPAGGEGQEDREDASTEPRQSAVVDTDSVSITITAPPPTGSVTVTGPSSLTIWAGRSYSVTARDLPSGEEGNYYVTVTSTGHLSESSSCSGSVSETYYPNSSTRSWSLNVYGCSIGAGTITARLFYVQFDPFNGGQGEEGNTPSSEPRQASLIDTDTEDVDVEPVEVEVDADGNSIYEGEDAEFTIEADVVVRNSLTVYFSVSEQGDVLDGSPPSYATIPSGSDSVRVRIDTDDDDDYESNGRITVTLQERTTYDVGTKGSDFVIVISEDPVPPPDPPTITSFLVSTTGGQKLATIGWTSVFGADEYLVENRVGSGSWKDATKYLPPTQPYSGHSSGDQFIVDCGGTNQFRVSAFGDGTTRVIPHLPGQPVAHRAWLRPRIASPGRRPLPTRSDSPGCRSATLKSTGSSGDCPATPPTPRGCTWRT